MIQAITTSLLCQGGAWQDRQYKYVEIARHQGQSIIEAGGESGQIVAGQTDDQIEPEHDAPLVEQGEVAFERRPSQCPPHRCTQLLVGTL